MLSRKRELYWLRGSICDNLLSWITNCLLLLWFEPNRNFNTVRGTFVVPFIFRFVHQISRAVIHCYHQNTGTLNCTSFFPLCTSTWQTSLFFLMCGHFDSIMLLKNCCEYILTPKSVINPSIVISFQCISWCCGHENTLSVSLLWSLCCLFTIHDFSSSWSHCVCCQKQILSYNWYPLVIHWLPKYY